MQILIVDMTHGGTILASEFSKNQDFEVLAWDIYHTLSDDMKKELNHSQIQLVPDNYLSQHDSVDDIITVAPVHCQLPVEPDMTHHQAVKYLLEDEIMVPVIEVTGVKGKTSTVHILKEIYKDYNPLILSSTGVEAIENGRETLLLEDISITPASIIKAWKIGSEYFNPGICIFESSLGGTGMADVGVLTNLAENYKIGGGTKNAAQAKTQIFKSKMVVAADEPFNSYYANTMLTSKVNTFSINQKSNLRVAEVVYGVYETIFTVELNDFKTLQGENITGSYTFSTFAPSPYHLENTLSAISAAFTMGTSSESISIGLGNFKGFKGRTSIFEIGGARIIQEVNPGINLTAVKRSVQMVSNYEDPALIFGGQYGITCEEIDEKALIIFLNNIDDKMKLILVDELGKSIYNKLNRKCYYEKDLEDAVNILIDLGSINILLIYRSNFSNLMKR